MHFEQGLSNYKVTFVLSPNSSDIQQTAFSQHLHSSNEKTILKLTDKDENINKFQNTANCT